MPKRRRETRVERRRREEGRVRLGIVVPKGWRLVPHGAADMTPCGCVSHVYVSIPAVQLVWRERAGRFWIRCMQCDARWSRRVLPTTGNSGTNGLRVDAGHPEERARRRAVRQ
jgi:hypothetical protein